MSMSNKNPGLKAGSGNNSRPSSKDGPKKNIWSSMLDSVANGKRLPEKNLLILGSFLCLILYSDVAFLLFVEILILGPIANTLPGGTPESQREFLETLSANNSDPSLSNERRRGRIPPIANRFALGYTYQDVLDADQEGSTPVLEARKLSVPFWVHSV